MSRPYQLRLDLDGPRPFKVETLEFSFRSQETMFRFLGFMRQLYKAIPAP